MQSFTGVIAKEPLTRMTALPRLNHWKVDRVGIQSPYATFGACCYYSVRLGQPYTCVLEVDLLALT